MFILIPAVMHPSLSSLQNELYSTYRHISPIISSAQSQPAGAPLSFSDLFEISEISSTVLGFLSSKDAMPLRPSSKLSRDQIADFCWSDHSTPFYGKLSNWRACFPKATAAKLAPITWGTAFRPATGVPVDQCVHLKGLRMVRCRVV